MLDSLRPPAHHAMASAPHAPDLVLDGSSLTLDGLEAVALRGRDIAIAPGARARVEAARRVVDEAVAAGRVVYGVTTGFGSFADVHIPGPRLRELQLNLVRSHAAGVGEPLGEAETRGLMLLRANVLAKGYSGVRPETLDLLVAMLNRRIHPVIPSQGSVGASGDLAPLAHLALALVGEGDVLFGGRRLPAAEALAAAGLAPVMLEAKEGLALINGTQLMTAVAGLALAEALRLALRGRRGRRPDPRRAEGHRRGLRRAHPRGAAAPRPGGLGAEPARAARGQRHPRVAP